ncbi:MAG TPA: DMT family transporter [Gammaproteobacteria bacterium]|nr:DMT family transporter [Gammaproteobacteria bacterium]
MTGPADNITRGALYVLAAAVAFSIMGALIKGATAGLPTEMVVFLRSVFSLLIMLPWLIRLRPGGLKTSRTALTYHCMRAATGLGAMYLLVMAIDALTLAEAMLLNQTAALFIPFIAFFWLGERFGIRILLALLIGFIGVTIILRPSMALLQSASFLGLGSGFLSALSMVTIRRNVRTEPPARIVFYFSVLATVGSAIPLFWAWQTPSLMQGLTMLAVGGMAVMGQMLITRGYALAPPARVGPFAYTTILFATLHGWLFWDEIPDLWTGLGAAFIIAGGILAMQRHVASPVTTQDGEDVSTAESNSAAR